MEIEPGGILDGADEVISFTGNGPTTVSIPLDGSDTTQHSVSINGTSVFIQYNAISGKIEITEVAGGVIPQADLDQLLQAITYENTSQDPTDTSDRTLTFTVTDDTDLTSLPAVATIDVVAVNDAPIIDLNSAASDADTDRDYADTFTEGGAEVNIVDPSVGVLDVDDTDLATLTITPAGVVDNNESLTIAGDAGAVINVLLDGIPSSQTIDVNGTTYTVTYDGTDIVVTDPAGEIPLADAQALLAATTYSNDDPTPTVGDRTFDITVNDGDADSNTATSTITVATDIATAAWSISGAVSVDEGASTTYTCLLYTSPSPRDRG